MFEPVTFQACCPAYVRMGFPQEFINALHVLQLRCVLRFRCLESQSVLYRVYQEIQNVLRRSISEQYRV